MRKTMINKITQIGNLFLKFYEIPFFADNYFSQYKIKPRKCKSYI